MKRGWARTTALASVVASLFVARPALADQGDACVSSYENAQETRRRGELARSSAELQLCVHACPETLARDCRQWLGEVQAGLGRLRLTVTGPAGSTLTGLRVHVDGVEVPVETGPVEADLDPGSHTLVLEAAGMVRSTRAIVIAPGKETALGLALTAEVEPTISGPRSVVPWVVGGAGIAALLGGGVLGLVGKLDVDDMRSADGCAPRCDAGRVDRVRAEWTSGAILAGVGGAAVVTSVVLLAVAPRARVDAALLPALQVDPRGAASVGWSTRF